ARCLGHIGARRGLIGSIPAPIPAGVQRAAGGADDRTEERMALDGASPTHPDRPNGVIIMYTTSRCGDCRATKAYLAAREVAFVEVDIEHDETAAAFVMQVNDGRRSVPTLVCGENAASLSRFSPSKAAAFLERCGVGERTTRAIEGAVPTDAGRARPGIGVVATEPEGA